MMKFGSSLFYRDELFIEHELLVVSKTIATLTEQKEKIEKEAAAKAPSAV